MTRDVEGTKRRIWAAALFEFAAHGRHGTTVERIAARAGVNKERIYAYFGDKEALFSVIVRDEVEKVAAAVPLLIEHADDVGAFAGRTFDYQQEHPDLARLVIWEGMSDTGAVPDEISRSAVYRSKVQAVARAQRAGLINDAIAPSHLVFLVLALASWWSASPQIARMLSTADPDDSDERRRRRAAVVEAAVRLTAPQLATTSNPTGTDATPTPPI